MSRHEAPLIAPEIASSPVGEGTVAIIPLSASPIERIRDDIGSEHDVIAWLDMPEHSFVQTDEGRAFARSLLGTAVPEEKPDTHVAICRRPPSKTEPRGGLSLLEFSEGRLIGRHGIDTEPKDTPKISQKPNTTDFTYGLGITRRSGNKNASGPAIVVNFRSSSINSSKYENPPTVRVAPDAAMQLRSDDIHTVLRTGNRIKRLAEKVKRSVQVGLGAVAVYSMFSSGGLVDRGLEGFNDAGKSTHARLDNAYNSRDLWLDIDGKNSSETKAQYQQSVDRVANVMEALDNHDHQAIDKLAASFKAEYANELMQPEQIKLYHEQIAQAKTPEEVMSVLSNFMHFYGKTANFLDHDTTLAIAGADSTFYRFSERRNSTAQAASLANSFIEAFGYFPSSMVKAGNFKDVVIAGGINSTTKEGVYDGTSLIFPIPSLEGSLVQGASDAAPDALADPTDVIRSIRHEYGHSLDVVGDTQILDGESQSDTTGTYTWSALLGIPSTQSGYAAGGSPLERRAEDLSHAFDFGKNGLADPNNYRAFISGANTADLKVFTALEARYPGITSYWASLSLNKRGEMSFNILPFAPSINVG